MRPNRYLMAGALLVAAACESSVAPDRAADTLLFMQFLPAANTSFARIDQGRIRIEGPTARTLTVAPGSTTTIEGLTPGTYSVALEGLTNGSVEVFGETSGVPVTAGRNTTVTVSVADFVPDLGALPATAVPGEAFTVQYGTVAGATAYVIEWSLNANFTGAQTLETPNTSASLTVNAEGTVHVRVRAKNRFGALGVPSTGGSVFLREATELLLVTPPVARIYEGQELWLAAHRLDELGTVLPGVTFTWSSASPAIATVDQNGLVTAHAPGTVAITAAGAGRTGAAEITVTDVLTVVGTHGGHTYALTPHVPGWLAARDLAVNHGGHLAVISSAGENAFTAGFITDRSWLGLTDARSEGEWVWTDDTSLDYTAWLAGEPNQAGNEDCGVQEPPDHWVDIDCALDGYRGLVEWDFQGPIGAQDMRVFQGRRYGRSLVPMTWTQARDLATSLGGQLVKIETAAEHDFLVSEYTQFGPHWIGLNDRETEGTFVWADGSAPSYTNWDSGEPNNSGEEDCGALWHDSQGRWNDFPCSGGIPDDPTIWAIIEWGT